MPGGKGNINGSDGKVFSKENQPKNRRKSTKFLTDLLTKNLKVKTEITVEGIDVVTGLPAQIKITVPTKEVIVQALLKKAAKGDMVAIKEIWDRTEGKSMQPVEMTGKDGKELNLSPIMFLSGEKLTDDQIEKYMKQDAGAHDESI